MMEPNHYAVLLLITERELCEMVASFHTRGLPLSNAGALCRDLMLAGF